MAAVTQRINSYLGGVSKQSDDKMLPGQVRECYNGFPDATYGLTKRPGFKHIVNLGTGTTYDGGKWFYIKRDDDEEYVGVLKQDATNPVHIWNALTGVACTITYGSTAAKSYLNGTKDNFKVITVQDTSIIINNNVTVTAQAAPTFTEGLVSSIEVQYVTAETTYTVDIKIGSSTQTATFTTPSSGVTIDGILTDLETDINAMTGDHANITVTKLSNSLELTSTAAMEVSAKAGIDNKGLTSVGNEVASVAELPVKSVNGRIIKIVNTSSDLDTYYAKFVAHDGVSGEGYWEETISPSASPGINDSTLPHELINTGVNAFTFKELDYENRLVGDDKTNPHPSFVDQKISAGFFHNNRLGFLSQDNVIMSQSGDFFNFYFKSSQTASLNLTQLILAVHLLNRRLFMQHCLQHKVLSCFLKINSSLCLPMLVC